MELLKFLTAPRIARRVDTLAHRVAGSSRDGVYARLSDQIYTMSFAESRGYIRARAAEVLHRHVAAALAADRPLPPGAKSEVFSRSMTLIVDRISDDLLHGRRLPKLDRKAA